VWRSRFLLFAQTNPASPLPAALQTPHQLSAEDQLSSDETKRETENEKGKERKRKKRKRKKRKRKKKL